MLRRLSQGIDKLISDYIVHQEKVEKLTANNYSVWEHRSYRNEVLQMFDDKQELVDSRNAKNNAFYKLKTIMDYWCALWFWEYDDAVLLPESRMDYWMDIQGLIGMSFSPSRAAIEEPEATPDMFAATEETEDTTVYTKQDANEILSKYKSSGTLFEENERIPVVQKLSERYHFFHPMLEFIEVFWLRDGFDIICGNPPWIKLEFDEKDIISEEFPEVSIRSISAPEVRKKRDILFNSSEAIRDTYYKELEESTCQGVFMNGYSNYPLLIGQANNLYKCITENGFDLLSDAGYMGLLHPESIYDDPHGQPFREEAYRRLCYHFQYHNELRLFAEVHHSTKFGSQIYGRKKDNVSFLSIHNLFHPITIDGCFIHDGNGICPGIKENGKWGISSHSDRIVHISGKELAIISETFEDSADPKSVKLVSIHSKAILSVLEKLSSFPTHVCDFSDRFITLGLNEAAAVDNGIIHRNVCYPNWDTYEMIFSGPHFYVSNPLYKTPRCICKLNSDYDTIDLNLTSVDYSARTNYTPVIDQLSFADYIRLPEEQTAKGEKWIDKYKLGFRRLVGSASERTLNGAILPPKSSHIDGVISISFSEDEHLIELSGLSSSIVLDFYLKSLGVMNFHATRLESLPLGIGRKYLNALTVRSLILNCISDRYDTLWSSNWNDSFSLEAWSISDSRLKPYSCLKKQWEQSTPLRNHFERRMALIEIDVITAFALDLSIDELILLYIIQFPVLQQNENDTWYDAKGNIVFTCSVGLKGVGVDRPIWEQIRNQKEGETYVHTIDPAKSELYGGQQVTYYAPYTKCDRIEDYRRAWAHFEKIFNEDGNQITTSN